MKYNLVSKRSNEVVHTVDLASGVGISGARTYFLGIKRIDKKEFYNLWKVMTKDEYDLSQEAFKRKPSSHPQANWWLEDKEIIDEELKI